MKVLIAGAGGFIGHHIAIEAAGAGHEIVACGRNADSIQMRFPSWKVISCDFTKDTAEDWLERLAGIDAVINAAGIFQSKGKNRIEAVHVAGPRALFEACAQLGISKLVQISALGADNRAGSQFHRTKLEADDYCLALASKHGLKGWTVIRPSLVIGRGGQSSALFAALGALPWPPRLGA